ncbi:MAG TPA: WhiB family transcriptional regulator [Streptosporangiaceae bacterium]|nr:WhiB family transcriptional regulator [Streptosporangiaceae bacterium]
MTYGTSAGSTAARLIPIVMPGSATPSLDEWHARGMCVGADPEIFFPSRGDPGTEARQICASCGVREDCLKYATEADELGIWAGLDQQQRRAVRKKQRRREAAAHTRADQPCGAQGAA